MKSGAGSCLATLAISLICLILLRFALPAVWKILAGLFTGALVVGTVLFLVLIAGLGYFTYKNLRANKVKEQEKQFAHADRTQSLYRSVVGRLEANLELNQVSADELLQSEILVGERLLEIKKDLIRLQDLVSPGNQRQLNDQLRDYQEKLRLTRDPAAQEVFRENLRMLQEKKDLMNSAADEIRRKEATIDLVYNSLVRIEDELKLGNPIRRVFPPDVYARFGLEAPASPTAGLPPMTEKSSTEG